ncbi:MAG: hypothetical protein M1526_06220 [Candidatus Thermoplasmatota archaeon]|nr:hypothetical protein [Candidatus Thermoplasmatota archaeon]
MLRCYGIKVTDSRVGPPTEGRGNGRRGFRRSHCSPPFSLVIALPVLVYMRIAAMKLNREKNIPTT